MVRKFIEEYRKWGLDLNIQKKKYIAVETRVMNITKQYQNIETTEENTHPGVVGVETLGIHYSFAKPF